MVTNHAARNCSFSSEHENTNLFRIIFKSMTIGPESQLGGQLVSDIASAAKNMYLIFQRNKYNRPGWQKLRGSTGGTRRKVWTRTKILSPNIRYFVAN